MHLKKFSLIRKEDKIELTPAYDLLNTSIVLKSSKEIALPIRGKKSKLKRSDLVDYFGQEKLGLSEKLLEEEMQKFEDAYQTLEHYVKSSFLPKQQQDSYLTLMHERFKRLRS